MTRAKMRLRSTSGRVQFKRAQLLFYKTETMLSRLQVLHGALIEDPKPHGDGDPPRRTRASSRSRSSRRQYRQILACMMGTYMVATDEARLAQFTRLLDLASRTRSLDGLESLFLTGLQTASALRSEALYQRGAALWKSLGAPKKIGGGLRVGSIYDSTTDTVVTFDATRLKAISPGGSKASTISADKLGGFVMAVQSIGAMDGAVASDGADACEGYFKAGGAIAGGIVGGIIGKTTGGVKGAIKGAIAGAASGAEVGDAVGGMVCGWFDSETSTSETSETSESESGSDSSSESSGSEEEDEASGSGSDSDSDADSGGGSDSDSDSGGDDDDGDDSDTDGDDDDERPPDDPYASMWTDSVVYGEGVASYVVTAGNGAFHLNGVPQLAVGGTLLAAGVLAGVPSLANQTAIGAADRFRERGGVVAAQPGAIAAQPGAAVDTSVVADATRARR